MKTLTGILFSLTCASAVIASEDGLSFDIGATYRGGMSLKVKGSGSHASGTAYSTSRTSGKEVSGKDSESASFTFGYTGGDRTFGSGMTAVGSGTVHADGSYIGGDYSAVYDDVYFSDNQTKVETIGGKTSTKSSAKVSGETAWEDGDDLNGWGVRADAELPLFDLGGGFELAIFAGLRGFWGIDGKCAGEGPTVKYTTSTSTSGAITKTTESFFDLTAPLNLDGTLDFDNAEVFEGSTVKYTPVKGTSSSHTSYAVSTAKIEAEADLYQVALGATAGFEYGRLKLCARPSLLLNKIDVAATRTERLTTKSGKVMGTWDDTADESSFVIGGGAELSLECAIFKSCGIFVAGGYEWVKTIDFKIGPQKVEIDASAWTVSAGFSYTF